MTKGSFPTPLPFLEFTLKLKKGLVCKKPSFSEHITSHHLDWKSYGTRQKTDLLDPLKTPRFYPWCLAWTWERFSYLAESILTSFLVNSFVFYSWQLYLKLYILTVLVVQYFGIICREKFLYHAKNWQVGLNEIQYCHLFPLFKCRQE